MLKYTNTRTVSNSDWDTLIIATYDKPYRFQQQEGCRNRGTYYICVPEQYPDDYEEDTIPHTVNGEEMGVSLKAWLAADPKTLTKFQHEHETKLFWERNFYPDISMLANDLYAKGLVEAGDYNININW